MCWVVPLSVGFIGQSVMLLDETLSAGLYLKDCSILSIRRQFTYLSVAYELNQNLIAVQKDLRFWNLKPCKFWWIKCLTCSRIGTQVDAQELRDAIKGISLWKAPLCTACQLSRRARKSASDGTIHANTKSQMLFNPNDLRPGQSKYMEQIIEHNLVILPNSFEKKPSATEVCAGKAFVDHMTR